MMEYKKQRIDVWNSKEKIIFLYSQGKSQSEIGRIFTCDPKLIHAILLKNNINIRPTKYYMFGHKFNVGKKCKEETRKKISKAHIGIKPSLQTIKKISETKKKLFAEGKIKLPLHIYKKGNVSMNAKKGYEIRKNIPEIINLYRKLFSTKKIAEKYNCSESLIKKILHEQGLSLNVSERKKTLYRIGKLKMWNKGKTNKEDDRILVREKHPMYDKEVSLEVRKKISSNLQGIPLEKWEKFISKEPYNEEWTSWLKNQIRKRDNQVCMNCGIHREKLKEALQVHHINYDKTLNLQQNLISLCRKCHAQTNSNRPYWTKLFQDKLSKLYDYQYDLNRNVILNMEVKK